MNPRPHAPGAAPVVTACCTLALLVALLAPGVRAAALDGTAALADTMRLAVVPAPLAAQPGDTVTVSLTVPVAGPAFNAYDAYLTYDPAVLQFLPAANVSTQEGPLMTAACGLRFHVFEADTLSGRLRVSHSLMCAGRSVTGPGVVYRVRFRCRHVDADTPLGLLRAAPYRTAFYLAGWELLPLATFDATLRVGDGSLAAAGPPAAGVSGLRAAPNPFNPRTTITLLATRGGALAVDVVTVDGRRVRHLWDGVVAGGPWSAEWDGRDDRGRAAAAGVYLVVARGASGAACTRVVLVR